MNDSSLAWISQEIIGRPLLLLPEKLSVVAGVLAERLGIDAATDFGPMRPETSRFVGSPIDEERRQALPYRRTPEGVGIITVTGSLVNRGAWVGASSGLTSYEGVKHQLKAASEDPKVGAILLDVESPGGQATGAFELAAAVRAASAVKPVHALANGMAASAAYALVSGASRVINTPSGILGSIGVVLMHADHSRRLDRLGITPTLIHAGARKVDGNPVQPLSEETRAALQGEVDALYDQFLGAVAEGRGRRLTAAKARETEAGIFTGQAAVAVGLADTVGTFEEVLDSLSRTASRRASGSTKTKRTSAMLEFSQAEVDRARAEGRQEGAAEARTAAERATADAVATARTEGSAEAHARIGAILSAEGTKGRERAALDLAMKSPGMSAEDVVGFVSANVGVAPVSSSRAGGAPIGLVVEPGGAGPGAEKPKATIDTQGIYARRAQNPAA